MCAWCREQFDRLHASGPIPKFCSVPHRQQAYRARQLRRFADEVERAAPEDRDLAARNFLKRIGTVAMPAALMPKVDTVAMAAALTPKIDTAAMIANLMPTIDTAAMIANLKPTIDTVAMAAALTPKIDTAAMIANLMPKIDTAAMIANLMPAFKGHDMAVDGSIVADLLNDIHNRVRAGLPDISDAHGLAPEVYIDYVQAVVVSALVLAVFVVLREQLGAAVAASGETFDTILAQSLFLLRIAAELQDESAEVRGFLGIAGFISAIAAIGTLMRRVRENIRSDPDAGPGEGAALGK